MERKGMSPTRLGQLALNDATFVSEFRQHKRDPRLSTVQRLFDFTSKYRSARKRAATPRRQSGRVV